MVSQFTTQEQDGDSIFEELTDWQDELGFTPGTISIQQFFLSERWIGIKDLPEHYQEVIDQPDEIDESRRRELEEDIRRWLQAGDFVLYWDEEYYLNAAGELESS